MGFFTSHTTLSNKDLQLFRSHQYKKAGSTLLEPILDPCFEFFAKLFPRSITPNEITVSGFICILIGMLLLIIYNPTLEPTPEYRPHWLYIVSAISVSLLMIMDAVDGKHARNTKQSSAVGHFLDHGFDSANITFNVINALFSINCGLTPVAMAACLSTQFQWITVWWEESVTDIVRFPFIADVEGSMLVISMNIASFIYGAELFHICIYVDPVFLYEWNLVNILCIIELLQNCINILISIMHIMKYVFNNKNHTTIYQAWKPILPFIFHMLLWSIYFYKSSTGSVGEVASIEYNVIKVITSGFLYAILAIRLILANLCHKPTDIFQPLTLAMIILVGNLYYCYIDQVMMLYIYCIIGFLYYSYTMYSIYCQVMFVKKNE